MISRMVEENWVSNQSNRRRVSVPLRFCLDVVILFTFPPSILAASGGLMEGTVEAQGGGLSLLDRVAMR